MLGIDIGHILLRVAASVAWTVLGVFIFYGGVRLYDLLDPIDYRAEIQRGNVAAGITLGAVIIGLAAIVIMAIVS
ncbi:MAG: hypothetical protein NVS4B8_20260 [Herpetosiphon sp.]